ncbi:unnamed protein product [Rotaria sordida]|uniref:Uncharacterized protein n=1 Tax=Rotaria sordida TaxID=392033 RepID=A0A813ZTQ2_9BILA|nr:unnamed protein product [Rotaria sordida]CAF4087798.1 unnamed protein product [Rotaria sordida]
MPSFQDNNLPQNANQDYVTVEDIKFSSTVVSHVPTVTANNGINVDLPQTPLTIDIAARLPQLNATTASQGQ